MDCGRGTRDRGRGTGDRRKRMMGREPEAWDVGGQGAWKSQGLWDKGRGRGGKGHGARDSH